MTRTFLHSFDPPSASPVNAATVDLDVADIEDAGIREVLQTPGAAYGAWSILDALLTPTGVGTPFVFREPLGQAREVKVALSGLLGGSSPALISSATSTFRSSRIWAARPSIWTADGRSRSSGCRAATCPIGSPVHPICPR